MVQWFQKAFEGQFQTIQFVKSTPVNQYGFRNGQILKIKLANSNDF